MNRQGSIEWQLETVGKMIFYVLILIALVFMTVKLIGLFTSGQENVAAQQNLKLFTQQAHRAMEDGKSSVIIDLPDDFVIVGYDANTKGKKEVIIEGTGEDLKVRHPFIGCGDACFCVYRKEQNENQEAEPDFCERIKGVLQIDALRNGTYATYYYDKARITNVKFTGDKGSAKLTIKM